MKNETISTILKPEKLKDLINIFKDLSDIKEHIRVKAKDGTMILYSIDDQNGQVLAFKFFKKQPLDFFDHDLNELDFSILNLKKFTKQLSLYESYNQPLSWTFECEDGTDLNSSKRMVKSLEVKNDKLKTFLIAGEPYIIRNLEIETIFDKVDLKYRRFGFDVSLSDFQQILKLIALNTTNETIEILLNGSDIIFREQGWELKVGETTLKESLLIKKKHFSNFSPTSDVNVDMFDNFVVLRGSDNDLLISIEHEN